ncbi:hypothetical protein ES708_24484 [subsurface metagenome]
MVVMASAATPVSVTPAVAARAATARTSKAWAGGILADRISYSPLDRVSVDSPKAADISRRPFLYWGIIFMADSSSMVETCASCFWKLIALFTVKAKAAVMAAPAITIPIPIVFIWALICSVVFFVTPLALPRAFSSGTISAPILTYTSPNSIYYHLIPFGNSQTSLSSPVH